ncbi:hypothetical protein O9K51_08069 [Purpureocillium lavendulum]|uniref:Uncharacterized protein n=1 Tax=Purpureocillium lavendulum TaxID=1247861 RepID=A0AB34FMN5_9HYPO|nr:hypothetical protein O9K51_08069 [Purpureocillium lavendulum]
MKTTYTVLAAALLGTAFAGPLEARQRAGSDAPDIGGLSAQFCADKSAACEKKLRDCISFNRDRNVIKACMGDTVFEPADPNAAGVNDKGAGPVGGELLNKFRAKYCGRIAGDRACFEKVDSCVKDLGKASGMDLGKNPSVMDACMKEPNTQEPEKTNINELRAEYCRYADRVCYKKLDECRKDKADKASIDKCMNPSAPESVEATTAGATPAESTSTGVVGCAAPKKTAA